MNRESDDLPLFEPDTDATYSLDLVAEITGVASSTIVRYQEHGLVPADPDSGQFTDEDLHTVRRIEHLRNTCEVNLSGLKLILQLTGEIDRLRAALRARR